MAAAVQDAARTAYERGGEGAEAIIVRTSCRFGLLAWALRAACCSMTRVPVGCNLASITTLAFSTTDFEHEMPHFVGYSEPAAPLYGGVIQLPGS